MRGQAGGLSPDGSIPGYSSPVQNPPPPDQHDTVVLGRPAPEQHDTAVLHRPAPEPPPVSAPIAPPGYPQTPTGWQAISDWRDAVVQGAPTAWSQVPPFVPVTPPILVMRNNPAVVGATLGSVALFLSLIPLLGLVSLILAPIGLLSSGIGLLLGVSRKVGRVGAIWGVMTSGLALLVCMAWTSLLLAL